MPPRQSTQKPKKQMVFVMRKGRPVAIDPAVHRFNQRKKRERKKARETKKSVVRVFS